MRDRQLEQGVRIGGLQDGGVVGVGPAAQGRQVDADAMHQGGVEVGVIEGGVAVAGFIAPDVEQQRIDLVDWTGVGGVSQPRAV